MHLRIHMRDQRRATEKRSERQKVAQRVLLRGRYGSSVVVVAETVFRAIPAVSRKGRCVHDSQKAATREGRRGRWAGWRFHA